MTACTTFQPSHYSNYNTPYGNVVKASGNAAVGAAQANTSYNCPSCTVSGNNQSGNVAYRPYNYNPNSDRINQITNRALDSLGYAISGRINQEIFNWGR